MTRNLSSSLAEGDVVLRPQQSPWLLVHRHDDRSQLEFRDLETGRQLYIFCRPFDQFAERRGYQLLERSHPAMPSGSVGLRRKQPDETGCVREEDIVMKKPNLNSKTRVRIPAGLAMTSPNAEPSEAATIPAPAEKPQAKAKKTRTVDYTRTDKRPHSFRYKRGSTFVLRGGAVQLSKESDGALVIGPAPDGAQSEAVQLEGGTLELVSVKKRPNGKTAIAFKHPELGEVVAYDARAPRAALRAS
jgi:hypothetical protein